jgi:small-conductance mechanosensitive channel
MTNGLTKRQKFWERMWTGSIFIYTIVATIAVWKGLSKYGVNPWIFAVIDAITSYTYGITSARMVIELIAKNSKSARKWALGASISFIIPQAYILISAQHAPTEVYRIVIGVIASLFAFTLLSLFLDLKRKSRQQ